jgi:hypothetical protein
VAGEAAVKARGEVYLPRPNPRDQSSEATARYESYLKRAVYYNASGRTLSGLIGMAFAKWPEIKLTPRSKFLMDNCDGAMVPLVQQAQATTAEVLKTGRAGILVDFPPPSGEAITQADVAAGTATATLNYYPATTIINWRSERIGSTLVLTLVVLREVENDYEEFGYTAETIYRVLRLVGGPELFTYVQEVWRVDKEKSTSTKTVYKMDETYTPLDGSGRPWQEIPFAFVGAVNNLADMESHTIEYGKTPYTSVSPLYDIAVLNIAHFRNSADYEDSVFICGQPQPWISGLDVEWRDKLIASGISIGSRVMLPLPVNASFGIATVQPNTLVAAAMTEKENQMRALGARLIQPVQSVKTATQSAHENSTDSSVLSLVCDNVSHAYTKALTWAGKFMGDSMDAVFSIDTQFTVNSLDAQSIAAVVQAWQDGAIPETDMWSSLRKMAVIDPQKTDEMIRAELDEAHMCAQGPLDAAAYIKHLIAPGATGAIGATGATGTKL